MSAPTFYAPQPPAGPAGTLWSADAEIPDTQIPLLEEDVAWLTQNPGTPVPALLAQATATSDETLMNAYDAAINDREQFGDTRGHPVWDQTRGLTVIDYVEQVYRPTISPALRKVRDAAGGYEDLPPVLDDAWYRGTLVYAGQAWPVLVVEPTIGRWDQVEGAITHDAAAYSLGGETAAHLLVVLAPERSAARFFAGLAAHIEAWQTASPDQVAPGIREYAVHEVGKPRVFAVEGSQGQATLRAVVTVADMATAVWLRDTLNRIHQYGLSPQERADFLARAEDSCSQATLIAVRAEVDRLCG